MRQHKVDHQHTSRHARTSSSPLWTRLGLGAILSGCAIALAVQPTIGSSQATLETLPRTMSELAGLTVATPRAAESKSDASRRTERPSQEQQGETSNGDRPEHMVKSGRPNLKTVMAPIQFDSQPRRGQQASDADDLRGSCPPVTTTHSELEFGGTDQPLVVQAGMVEGEEAAVSFQIDPDEFPIIIRKAEIVWSSQELADTVTIGYQFRVYEGNPRDGIPVFVEPSESAEEGGTLPDVVLNPVSAPAVNLTILVDPNDSEQILLTNNDPATNATFSVGFRIITHNQPPTEGEVCGVGGAGWLPAECVGPDETVNGFPTTDGPFIGAAPDVGEHNWLLVRSNCGSCAVPCNLPPFATNCWWTFENLHLFGVPISGDWNIRVTYEPAGCPTESGACCFSDGSCDDNVVNTDCVDMGGTFQGDASNCASTTCPQPTGGCCFTNFEGEDDCTNNLTQTQCQALEDGFWLGAGVTCASGSCDPPEGACCIPDTGGCLQRVESFCDTVGGVWLGANTPCVDCFGVCCLPDGSCEDNGGIGLLEDECIAIGGNWDGSIISCGAADCPDPVGACCLSNGNCVPDETEQDCGIFGGTWGGAGTTCAEACAEPTGACCFSNGNCVEELTESDCTVLGGVWGGDGSLCAVACDCPGDADGNGVVDVQDLILVISNWGSDGSEGGDVNSDGIVDVQDLIEVISNWGSSCN